MGIKKLLLLLCFLALTVNACPQSASRLPRIEGDSLAGPHVVLPDSCAGKVALLVFGFTKASKNQTSAWASAISKDFAGQREVELYQLPVLEDVPRFVRGMVISGIKKGVAENARPHFVPILEGQAELKKLVMFTEPDDAYLIVLDRDGKIAQQRHGAVNDAAVSDLRVTILRATIAPLLNRPN